MKKKTPISIDIIHLGGENAVTKRQGIFYDKAIHPIDFDHLYAVEGHRDHKRLLEMEGSAIVIAGSGMCTGGRIVDHLKAGITDRKNDIFFVGYQAKGTPGRDIVRYSKRPGDYVWLDGEKFMIEAKVHKPNRFAISI